LGSSRRRAIRVLFTPDCPPPSVETMDLEP
jgi:hypothetical protein